MRVHDNTVRRRRLDDAPMHTPEPRVVAVAMARVREPQGRDRHLTVIVAAACLLVPSLAAQYGGEPPPVAAVTSYPELGPVQLSTPGFTVQEVRQLELVPVPGLVGQYYGAFTVRYAARTDTDVMTGRVDMTANPPRFTRNGDVDALQQSNRSESGGTVSADLLAFVMDTPTGAVFTTRTTAGSAFGAASPIGDPLPQRASTPKFLVIQGTTMLAWEDGGDVWTGAFDAAATPPVAYARPLARKGAGVVRLHSPEPLRDATGTARALLLASEQPNGDVHSAFMSDLSGAASVQTLHARSGRQAGAASIGGSAFYALDANGSGFGNPLRVDFFGFSGDTVPTSGGPLNLTVFAPSGQPGASVALLVLGNLGAGPIALPGIGGRLGLDLATLVSVGVVGVDPRSGIAPFAFPVPGLGDSTRIHAQALVLDLVTTRASFTNTATVDIVRLAGGGITPTTGVAGTLVTKGTTFTDTNPDNYCAGSAGGVSFRVEQVSAGQMDLRLLSVPGSASGRSAPIEVVHGQGQTIQLRQPFPGIQFSPAWGFKQLDVLRNREVTAELFRPLATPANAGPCPDCPSGIDVWVASADTVEACVAEVCPGSCISIRFHAQWYDMGPIGPVLAAADFGIAKVLVCDPDPMLVNAAIASAFNEVMLSIGMQNRLVASVTSAGKIRIVISNAIFQIAGLSLTYDYDHANLHSIRGGKCDGCAPPEEPIEPSVATGFRPWLGFSVFNPGRWFDDISPNRKFGHTVIGIGTTPIDGAWLEITMQGLQASAAFDTISLAFIAGSSTFQWTSPIQDLPEANGSWGITGKTTFCLDLAKLPLGGGGTFDLRPILQAGALDICVGSALLSSPGNTAVDCLACRIYRCKPTLFPAPAGIVAMTGADVGSNNLHFVVQVLDTRNPNCLAPGRDTRWEPPWSYNKMPNPTGDPADVWSSANLGEVFGIDFDDDPRPNIYVTSTTSYGASQSLPGSGKVFRLNGTTGKICLYAVLPNAGQPGLGNIAYDREFRQFFVTNFEDGKIYRLAKMDPGATCGALAAILQAYDPFGADNGAAGFAPLTERIWGVGVYGCRVYFGTWSEDINRPGPANRVYSVALDASGAIVPPVTLEITLPPIPGTNYTQPISDIAFSPCNDNRVRMLIAERAMTGDRTVYAHNARVLEYEHDGTSWGPSVNAFHIGIGSFRNSAGGVDYDCATADACNDGGHVMATGDLLHYGTLDRIYGLQILPDTGGDTTDSYLIDADREYGPVNDKSRIGDVAVFRTCNRRCIR